MEVDWFQISAVTVFESTTEVSLREGTDGYCYGSLEMDSNFIQNREFWEGAGGS